MITDTIYEHLQDIRSIQIQHLISNATIIEPSDTLSNVVNKILKNNSYDVFYFNGKSTLSTNIRTLLNAKSITTMKVEPFLYHIPHVNPSNTIQQVANIIARFRIREVPVIQNKKIVGVVTAKQILKLLLTKDNKWIKASQIYTQQPMVISSEDSLSNAKRIMTSKKIDHLPVMNHGKIKQVITSTHILEFILPPESQGRKSMGTRTIRKLESKIGNIGSTRIPQCTPNDDLNTIINLMLKTETSCCLVNLWENLHGIITYRDILGVLALKLETPIPLYIIGLPEGLKNVTMISSKFEKTLKRLQNVYSEIHEARISIKQQRTGGKKEGKYDVSIMIITPHYTPLIFNSVGFDLSNVLEELSQKLLASLSKRAKKRSKISIRKIELPTF